MGNFVTYEKNIETVVTRIKHRACIRLNATPDQIIDVLSNIPSSARLSMVVNDSEESALYGELIFEEEIHKD